MRYTRNSQRLQIGVGFGSMEGKVFSLVLVCLVVGASVASEEKCKKNSDKPTPSAGTRQFGECKRYQNKSCCNANYTHSLRNDTERDHKAEWDKCGKPSEACLQYLLDEACLFHCDPYLYPWRTGDQGAVSMVPVCKSSCDAWFDACKDQKTCAMNWKYGYNKTGGALSCKANSTCKTFTEVYGNAKGLCEKMWGSSFSYDEDNKNCMKITFDGANPNQDVTKPTMPTVTQPTTDSAATRSSYVAVIYLVALALVFRL